MNGAFPDAEVTGYLDLAPSMGNEPKDRHVLAAAVKAGAQTIVTTNLRHYPHHALVPFDVQVQSPDEFLSDLLDLARDVVMRILQEQSADLRDPPLTVKDVLAQIAQTAPGFASAVGTSLDHAAFVNADDLFVDKDVTIFQDRANHHC